MTERGLETIESAIGSLLDGGTDAVTVEIRARRADGTVVPGEVTLTLQPSDGESFAGTVGVVRDVTERRERQQELEAAEERFRKFFEYSNDAAFIIDVEADEIRDANPAATDLLGYSRDELRGMEPADLHPENLDRIVEFTETVVEEGNGSLDDVTCHGRGGPVECEMSAAVCEVDGRTCLINSIRDISERKARERELEQQNERLDAFAGIVSHDLRNPLTVVDGQVELARDLAAEGASGEELLPQLEAIAEATDRMLSMTEDLLTLSRQGDTVGERRPVALAPLAREVWSTLDTEGATLETRDPGQVEADRTRLEQLLANLLENAVEHGSTGSRTGSDAAGSRTDGGDDEVTVAVVGTADGFAVTDDGPGIPPAERDDVFERGYSTEQGTGFGLAIVRTVAEAHGWTVTVGESEAGGARFAVHTDD
jgi:PAS domain S-box-containing protein